MTRESESWGRAITPNEEDWVGDLIDTEIQRRDDQIEKLRRYWDEALKERDALKSLVNRLRLSLGDPSYRLSDNDLVRRADFAYAEADASRNDIEVLKAEIKRLQKEDSDESK